MATAVRFGAWHPACNDFGPDKPITSRSSRLPYASRTSASGMSDRRRRSNAVGAEQTASAGGGREYAARLAAVLALELGRDAVVCLSCPIGLLVDVLPLLVVTAPPIRSMPLPPDGALLVVVADESAEQFEVARSAAERLAGARVPEVWLWRGPGEWLERLSVPVAGLYRERTLLHPGEPVELSGLGRVVTLP